MKNSSTNKRAVCAVTALAIASVASGASAAPTFIDDFESGSLANWTGKSLGAHDAFIVVDPLNVANHAITFDTLEAGGEIFSQHFDFDDSESYQVSFDYLGFSKARSVADNYGGFVGISLGTPGIHQWVYGTSTTSGASDSLVDDGAWHSYTFSVAKASAFNGTADGFRLMLEDFSGSGGVAGDVLFDNIEVRAVPAPGSGVLAVIGFACASRRRQRTC